MSTSDFFSKRKTLLDRHETECHRAVKLPANRQQKLFYLPKEHLTSITEHVNRLRDILDHRDATFTHRHFQWTQDYRDNPSEGTLKAKADGKDWDMPEPEKPIITAVIYVDGKQVSEIKL